MKRTILAANPADVAGVSRSCALRTAYAGRQRMTPSGWVFMTANARRPLGVPT
jgi:hypothetical protein